MSDYQLLYVIPISEKSFKSDNCGQAPIEAKYIKHFKNNSTGKIVTITDLDSRKYKRKGKFDLFKLTYEKPYKEHSVSIFSSVVNLDVYPTITKFIDTIKKKLGRKGFPVLGYVWTNDIGDIKFNRHLHILFATPRMGKNNFMQTFKNKKQEGYDIQFMKSWAMRKYCIKKELYGAAKQRSYGCSKKFRQAPIKPLIKQGGMNSS